MTTLADRARALEGLELTPRQARFLALVALHGGYCLRRQYAKFAGVCYGKNVCDFLESLVARRWAQRFVGRADRGHVYHLSARTIYERLGQGGNRNRRSGSSAALIARKLMVLDYVLEHADTEWLATEADKVTCFVTDFGVALEDLPRVVFPSSRPGGEPTVRYFPHKLPVAVAGEPPAPQFVCLVTDDRGRRLDEFLRDHATLLRRLPAWAVVALGPRRASGLSACATVFARFVGRPAAALGVRADDLRWFLPMRRAVDRGEWASLTVADLDRFRLLRERVETPAFEALYRDWLQHGDAVLAAGRGSVSSDGGSTVGRLVTAVLPFDYSQFGSLPGVA